MISHVVNSSKLLISYLIIVSILHSRIRTLSKIDQRYKKYDNALQIIIVHGRIFECYIKFYIFQTNLHYREEGFWCTPFVQYFAKNIIEIYINFMLSNLHSHETLSIIKKFHLLWVGPIVITPPCLWATPTC